MQTIAIPNYSGFCARCVAQTHFRSVAAGQIDSRGRRYNVLLCTQCAEPRFIIEQKHKEYGSDSWFETTASFPPQPAMPRPSWLHRLDPKLRRVMESIYLAQDQGHYFLVAIGIRTAMDMLICERVGDKGTFSEKRKAMRDQGHLGADLDHLLDALIESGNAATHRGFEPEKEITEKMVQLAECLINWLVIHNADLAALKIKATAVKRKTPPRAPNSTAGSASTLIPTDPGKRLEYILKRLVKLKPRTEVALTNSIEAMFQFSGGIELKEVNALVRDLVANGHLVVTEGKVKTLKV